MIVVSYKILYYLDSVKVAPKWVEEKKVFDDLTELCMWIKNMDYIHLQNDILSILILFTFDDVYITVSKSYANVFNTFNIICTNDHNLEKVQTYKEYIQNLLN